MKLKRRDLFFGGALIIIIAALIWKFGGVIEGFTGNPIPTLADVNSYTVKYSMGPAALTGTPSPTMKSVLNWLKSNAPIPSGMADNDIYGVIIGLYDLYTYVLNKNPQPFIDFIQSMPSGGSVNDNMTKVANFINTTYQPSRPIDPNDLIELINKGQSLNTFNGLTAPYWAYVYVLGKPGSSPAPAPAPSSSTQPTPTPTNNIVSPCHPSYKSVPGGTMEFKCFN